MANSTVPKEWQAPPPESSESHKLGWLNESVEQGAAFNDAQRGSRDWRKAFDILSGNEAPQLLDYRSNLSGRRLKTNIRTAISGLANIRPLWGFRAGEAFADYANVLNRTCWSLYLEGYWDQDVKEVLWWAAATGSGFIRPVYRRNLQGNGNIFLDSFGVPCVLPVQMPRNGDYQGAYAVTLLEEVPIYEAHWRFRDFQDQLKPTSSRYWYSPDIRKASESNAVKRAYMGLMGLFRRGAKEDKLTDQYIPLRWTTINDLRINTSGKPIAMGEPGSSWYYEVPALGDRVSNGAGGYREADENDCKLYPQRRVMISSENCVMYDGPGFNWCGDLDLLQFTVDKQPWEPIGFSMVHDGWELQKAIDRIDRGAMDKLNAQQDLPLCYPIDGVTKTEAEAFDPLAPRTRVGYDSQVTDQAFKPAVPPEVYLIGQEPFLLRKQLVEDLDNLHGTRDIIEMSKVRALGDKMDDLEAIIAADGPLVRDISRSMENSLGRVGSQVGWLILQYMPTARLMQYANPETMSLSVWDYDPASLIPSHLPGEDPHEADKVTPRISIYTKMQRAKWFAKNIRFFLMPHSVHEVTQITRRLTLMQLRQRGYPISAATVMTACEVANVEKPKGNTEQEQYRSEKEFEIAFAGRLQAIVNATGIDLGLTGGPPGGPISSSPASGGSKGGRPSTDAVPPHLEVKGDGRSTVATSQ